MQTKMQLHTVALLIIAKNLTKLGYPSIDECISKVRYIDFKVIRIYHPKICLIIRIVLI